MAYWLAANTMNKDHFLTADRMASLLPLREEAVPQVGAALGLRAAAAPPVERERSFPGKLACPRKAAEGALAPRKAGPCGAVPVLSRCWLLGGPALRPGKDPAFPERGTAFQEGLPAGLAAG